MSTQPNSPTPRRGWVGQDTVAAPAPVVDFNESDKVMLEAMGVHRVVRLLFEMRVLNGPVWGSDANGSLFLGWCEKDHPENVAERIDREGNWGKQDLTQSRDA